MKISDVINSYGLTENHVEAGYILSDGTMLDFSEKNNGGEPGLRTLDHRDVNEFYNLESSTDAMNLFLHESNSIRISAQNNSFCFDLLLDNYVSIGQLKTIKKIICQVEYVAVDVYRTYKENSPFKTFEKSFCRASDIDNFLFHLDHEEIKTGGQGNGIR